MMKRQVTNIDSTDLEAITTPRGTTFRQLDLSGEHLGVRIEELSPGDTSSHHHFHTLEEEHVLVLAGSATLHLGSETVEIGEGDHVWFPAGEPTAHHIENTSAAPFRFLVFGERRPGDVVFYPNGNVALVKALGNALFRYEPKAADGE